LKVIESFKQQSKEEGVRDQHALLVDFLRYGVAEKNKELEAVKAQHAAISADLQTVLVGVPVTWLMLLARQRTFRDGKVFVVPEY